MRTYEAMFLFDPTVGTDGTQVEQEIRRLMDRAQAEIIQWGKWDERKLAYEIEGRKRGCYVLTFFKADPGRIKAMERDAQLSESVLRVLVLRADHLSEEDMKRAFSTRAGESGERGERGERGEKEERRGHEPRERRESEDAPSEEEKPASESNESAPVATAETDEKKGPEESE